MTHILNSNYAVADSSRKMFKNWVRDSFNQLFPRLRSRINPKVLFIPDAQMWLCKLSTIWTAALEKNLSSRFQNQALGSDGLFSVFAYILQTKGSFNNKKILFSIFLF